MFYFDLTDIMRQCESCVFDFVSGCHLQNESLIGDHGFCVISCVTFLVVIVFRVPLQLGFWFY